MNQEHKYIYIYNTILILICGFILYMVLRPASTTSKSQNTRQQAINYPTKTNQAITSVDAMGNLSALSFPTGFILIWYPPDTKNSTLALVADTVPAGWAICDGTQGTPDLRGRFVLMASDTPNGAPGSKPHAIYASGGEENHQLSVDEMPSHIHPTRHLNTNNTQGGDSGLGIGPSIMDNNYGSLMAPTGGNQPHNLMTPFYSLVYVMKL